MQDSPMILVVEDDGQVQVLVEEAINEGGFRCVIAATGEEAKTLLIQGTGKYRALITDINLGRGIDGWEVGRNARELNPDIAVIYMTGDSAEKWTSSGVPHSIILSKPFAAAQVVTAVAQHLNTSDASNGAAQTGQLT